MDGQESFTQGVVPGGLQRRDEAMALIGWLLTSLPQPLTRDALLCVMAQSGLANYFNASDALGELLENGAVIMDGAQEQLAVLPEKREVLLLLAQELPLTVRETALETARQEQALARRAQENHIEINAHGSAPGGGYDVRFRMESEGDSLMQLTVFAADWPQAQMIRAKFLENPARFYEEVIQLLTRE